MFREEETEDSQLWSRCLLLGWCRLRRQASGLSLKSPRLGLQFPQEPLEGPASILVVLVQAACTWDEIWA